jgi:signal transduction histidine kinase
MNKRSDQTAIDALYRIVRVVNSTEDPKEALELIIDEIMNVLPADSAAIELINPDNNCLEVEVSRGFPRSLESTQLKVGTGLTGWVAFNGKALNVSNVKKDPRYIEVDPRIVSELVVPMCRDDGSVIGVVNVDGYRENAFSSQDKKVLTLMASEATRVLSRIWLIQKLRQTAHQLEVLIDIAQSVVAKRQLDEILQTITIRSMEIIPCSLSAIFLKDEEADTLSLRASSGEIDTVDTNETISFAESAIGTAFTRQKTIEITDLPKIEENHFSSLIQEKNLASMISCPIKFENEAIGVLNIYTNYAHRFNNTEKRVFETLASLGATAIRNAQLYERIFQSEENLRRSERLTTLGLLSAEIAHEIRNPLTVIQLLFESLALDFPAEDLRQKDVHIIQEKLGQLESIVSRVLSFGKSQQEMHYCYNVNKLIEDTLHLVRLKLRQSRVELVFNQDSVDPPQVDVNKGQIQQAILNLLINATQAMSNGGHIEISTTVESDMDNDVAVIRISDSGSGIDPGIQDTIFDSFLTGRPDGTGLGLSIVKRILKSHSGSISVESSSSKGTTMKMVLPLADNPR